MSENDLEMREMEDADFLDIDWTEAEDSGDNVEFDDDNWLPQVTRRTVRDDVGTKDPEAAEVLKLAYEAFGDKRPDEAIELAREAIKFDREAIGAYRLLATIYDEIHDPHRAFLARYSEAHLDKQNKELWKETAQRGLAIGDFVKVSAVLQHLSRLERGRYSIMFKRAQVYQELGQFTRVISILERLRNTILPAMSEKRKTDVLTLLAKAYKAQGRLGEITDIYLDLYRRSTEGHHDQIHTGPDPALNYQNLHVLAELLMDQKLYSKIVSVIKDGARFLQGRSGETWWQNETDDAEYDDRGFGRRQFTSIPSAPDVTMDDIDAESDFDGPNIPDGAKSQPSVSTKVVDEPYTLPIDIRSWLLSARLKQLKLNPAVAQDVHEHLKILQSLSLAKYNDLYHRAAHELFAAGLFDEAYQLFTALTEFQAAPEFHIEVLLYQAKALAASGSPQEAEKLYENLIRLDNGNVEALLDLGILYQDSGRRAGAKTMSERARLIRAQRTIIEESQEPSPRRLAGEGHPARDPERPPGARLTAAERNALELKAQARADRDYMLLSRYENGLLSGNPIAVGEWLRIAGDLIDMYVHYRKHYPSDRSKRSVEFISKSDGDIDERLARLQRDQENDDDGDEDEPDAGSREVQGFRERPYTFWFSLFMRAALAQAQFESLADAKEILQYAEQSNVFATDPERMRTIELVTLACANIGRDYQAAIDQLRRIFLREQFSVDVLRLYSVLLPSGSSAMATFASSNNQKFFLRQIKALDSIVDGASPASEVEESVTTAARSDLALKHADNPLLHVLYAYLMLMGPSYVPALTYLLRALDKLPNEPVILLTAGVVNIQRGLQRVSPDRHMQILQGLTFLQRYKRIREKGPAPVVQEVEYNYGRAFHGIGLFHLAIPYYQRACELRDAVPPQYDLSREAAYNLHLIYAVTGNMGLSRKIIDEYLTL